MNARLTVRMFFLGYDVALGRTWEFHDHLAARRDTVYRLHVIGRYPGPPDDLESRAYVVRDQALVGVRAAARPPDNEVWVIRGWNHPLMVSAAVAARCARIPTLMWSERPGATWEAATLGQALRIKARRLLLPLLFLPYRRRTIMLGAGRDAVEEFKRLGGGSPGRLFPYPNPVADACLAEARPISFDEEPLFLFLGNFTRLKALDLIIRACEDLWRLGYRFRVRYVGQGPLRGALEQHVGRSEDRAELYSVAGRKEVVRHLREAGAVLLPSRRDGWGLPVHEGLAARVPVVVSDACGAADLVADSGCGKVIQAGDKASLVEAMKWVIGLTPQERKLIGDRALDVAKRLTVPELADKLLVYCREARRLKN